MKRLFNTPKKAIISVLCVVVVIAAISVMTVKNTLITRAEAKAVALQDAGLSETEASALRARLGFDDGRFQYEVDFYNDGAEYEYLIQAKDGDIIARDIEGGANGNAHGQEQPQETGEQSAADRDGTEQPREAEGERPVAGMEGTEQPREAEGERPAAGMEGTEQPREAERVQPAADGTVQSGGKSLDEAKAAALRDAGLAESDVTFKKTELDYDHGMQVYDIEFYTFDTEYDYEISASDGTVVEKSVESFQLQANPANSSDNNYIGVDRAKEIALNHANLNETDVRFAKAKLENDDGSVEYEIEFYSGRTEYEYTIDAVSGKIIEYDVDYD